MKESQIFLTLDRDRHLEVYRKKMNLYIYIYFTVYAFTIHGCLAPLPIRDERGSVSTVQSVLDRMSRSLQGIRRTIEMNPSLETLRRVLRELRHLLRNVERLRSEIPSVKYNQMHSAIGTVTSFVENSIEQQEQPRTAINNTSHSSRSSADVRPRIPRQNEGKVEPPKVKVDRARLERLLDLGFTVRQIAHRQIFLILAVSMLQANDTVLLTATWPQALFSLVYFS